MTPLTSGKHEFVLKGNPRVSSRDGCEGNLNWTFSSISIAANSSKFSDSSSQPGLSSALLEMHVGNVSVSSVRGQQVVLPVWYKSSSQKKPYILWVFERPGASRLQILTYINGIIKVEDTSLKHRIGFVHPVPHFNVSIFINNTQEVDSGQYVCTVNVEDDSAIDGKNIGLLNLTVLVPPSAPTCQIHGSPYVGGNITMSCKSPYGKPIPKYRWERTAPTAQHFIEPFQDPISGNLMLKNLSREMSGTYVCTAKNNAGISKCNITLEVNSYNNAAVIAGAVVGCLIGIGLITVCILQFFVCRKKKKNTQEEMANEIKEDAVAPKTLSWAKGSGSDTVSKNGTLSSVNTTRDHKLYMSKPVSDTASIITAAGSTVGYKPQYTTLRSGTLTPTPSLSSQSLPLYFPPVMNGNHYQNTVPSNRNALHRTNGPQLQPPQQEPAVPQGLTTSTLARMGAVPVMVPAQSHAGSLV
ncbi:endothelial cell-selective adhesion molecule [Alligator mississippiensis]|uniref:Endothelial cell-selective adhesion molecule n=1 Tax=Alligator mississippiensis TaxID=8496 RepID=A0A151NGB9_ALLMI|nr:endothelial cell-selective adhesion molecule [Alligator mississippiensis]